MNPSSWKVSVKSCLRGRNRGVDRIDSFRVQAAGASIIGAQDTLGGTSMLEVCIIALTMNSFLGYASNLS